MNHDQTAPSIHRYLYKIFELLMGEAGYYQPSKKVWKTVDHKSGKSQ